MYLYSYVGYCPLVWDTTGTAHLFQILLTNFPLIGTIKKVVYTTKGQLSNEKRAPGCLVYIGDEKLPSYVGIIINHYKYPY